LEESDGLRLEWGWGPRDGEDLGHLGMIDRGRRRTNTGGHGEEHGGIRRGAQRSTESWVGWEDGWAF
jgi:hypothetical protein